MIAQSSLIDELVHAAGGFFYGAADHVDFLGGGLVAWLRVNGDPAAALRRSGRPFRRTCIALDADDIGQRNLHPHGSGFDFGDAPIMAAKHDGLA